MAKSDDLVDSTIEAGGLRARLLRSSRRSISLQIEPDLGLLMRAPLDEPRASIEAFLARKGAWVRRHRARLERIRELDPEPRWADGSSVPYLGRRVELRVARAKGDRGGARFADPGIVAAVPDPADGAAVRRAVERLLVREAARLFPRLLEECLAHPRAKGLPRPKLRLRSMKTRWGSCDTAKVIVTLNVRLLRFPVEVIESVVYHELAHLRYRGHGERFYALLGGLCPRWKELGASLSGVILD
jgi:predicted metal-dependent hydrolase